MRKDAIIQSVSRLLRRQPRHVRLIATLVLVVLLAIAGRLHPGLFDTTNGGRGGGRSVSVGVDGEIKGAASVIDGDSMKVGGAEIRMKDIDAPEGRQLCQRDGRDWPCGEEARRVLAGMTGGKTVTCRSVERDKHGRYLAYCSAGGLELNREMVARGYAVGFGGFRNEERQAKAARRGVWQGEFQRPQAWRHERGIGL
ncbi:MAG: thermonuclease family protein [Hyphomicrobiaceae bacterium]|nr:thermonuclease family protein [Hyphomicrobiaceae bacterium]